MTRRKSSLEDRAGQMKFEQQIKRGQVLTRLKVYQLRARAWRYMMSREYEEYLDASSHREKERLRLWHWREACHLIRPDMTRQQALDAILALRESLTDEQRKRRIWARVPSD
jgi:hypothetical protein